MTQQMSFDPFALWKQMYDKMEEHWSQTIDESMHKEDFSKWMGQCLNGYLQYQDMARKSTEQYLQQANMPSRQDLANVASIVVNIEEKVDSLEQTIEDEILDSLKQMDTVKEIRILKTEVSKISKKLDQITELLQAKVESAAALSQPSEGAENQPAPGQKTE